jgi:sec-independent protein translocase protein TatA
VIGDILQPTHLLFILVIALLVLGPKRLPEVGRALGNGLRDFKSAIIGDDEHDEIDHHDEITDAPGFENYRSESMSDDVGEPATDTASAVDKPAPGAQAAEPTADAAASVTSTGESAPPAHPEDASAAATQPSDGVASEPATERTERLG